MSKTMIPYVVRKRDVNEPAHGLGLERQCKRRGGFK